MKTSLASSSLSSFWDMLSPSESAPFEPYRTGFDAERLKLTSLMELLLPELPEWMDVALLRDDELFEEFSTGLLLGSILENVTVVLELDFDFGSSGKTGMAGSSWVLGVLGDGIRSGLLEPMIMKTTGSLSG